MSWILLLASLLHPLPQALVTARSSGGFTWTVGTSGAGNESHNFSFSGSAVNLSLTPVNTASRLFCWGTSTNASNTISDTGTHTWTRVGSEFSSGYGNLDEWTAPNTSTASITITYGTGGSASAQCVEVYKSNSASITTDANGSGSTANPLHVSLTTAHANEIILMGPIPGSGGTLAINTGTSLSTGNYSGAYITESTSGTYTDPSLNQTGGGSQPGAIVVSLY